MFSTLGPKGYRTYNNSKSPQRKNDLQGEKYDVKIKTSQAQKDYVKTPPIHNNT